MTEQEIEKGLMTCIHCGFCLQACPTYRETGDEADSPRGRIVLMRAVHEGKLSFDGPSAPGTAAYHLDRCLGCRACETACPSGVPYGRLLEQFRDRQERRVVRRGGEKLLRAGLLGALTRPGRMALALRAGKMTRGRIPAFAARMVGLPEDFRMPLPENLREASRPLPAIVGAQGQKRGRVALLTGCVMRVLFAPVHHATARVLAANGIEVVVPPDQGCCGALHGHQGQLGDAKDLARRLIAEFEKDNYDAILINSAGCGSFIKDYGHLLSDDPAWAERARSMAAKVKDISEYLATLTLRPMSHPIRATVTYHDACHLAHGQKIAAAPRALLRQIPGVEYVELADADTCCGSAGVYNYLQPEMATALQRKKVANILATKATIVATANPGCLAWIKSGLPPENAPEIVHPIELLDRAYHGTRP